VAVTATDLDGQTSGGTWTINKLGMDQFLFANDGAGGTDYAYLFRDSSSADPNSNGAYSQVTLTTPVDFTLQPVVVSFDMAATDPNAGQARPMRMIGYSGTTEVFRFDWTIPATDDNPTGFLRSWTAESSANSMGEGLATTPVALMNPATTYNPATMKTFTVTLNGTGSSSLKYTAEGSTGDVVGTVLNGQTQLTSIRWSYNSTGDPAGIWLDNVTVTPEPASLALLSLGGLTLLRRRR
jgi:MYXO-CTERM domain-containing protein